MMANRLTTPAPSLRVGAWVAFGLYTLALVYFVRQGQLNHDEGWYLYVSNLVYDGAFPYRDFAFFQGPLLPYVYGLFQRLLGPGIEVGRWTSACLSLITIGIGARLCDERGGRLAVVFYILGFALTPWVLWIYTTTRTEPLTAPLLMTASYFAARVRFGTRSAATATGAAVLAAAARVSLVPTAILVAGVVLIRCRRSNADFRPALVVLVVIAVAAAAFVAIDPTSAGFSLYTAPAHRHERLAAAPEWSAGEHTAQRARFLMSLAASYGFVPQLSIIAAALVAAAGRRSAVVATVRGPVLFLVAMAALAHLPYLTPRFAYPEYFGLAFPLLLAACAMTLGTLYANGGDLGRRAVLAIAAALFFYQLVNFTAYVELRAPSYRSDLADLRDAAAYLRKVVPADKQVLTMATYLAVESGRRVPPGWEMNSFAYFPRMNDDEAERLHVIGAGGLAKALQSAQVGAVVASDNDIGIWVHNYRGFRPSRPLQQKELHWSIPALQRFRLDRTIEDFGQYHDNLYILLPATTLAQ